MEQPERFDVVMTISVEITDEVELAAANDFMGDINGELGVMSSDNRWRVEQALMKQIWPAGETLKGFKVFNLAGYSEDWVPMPALEDESPEG